MIKDLIPKLIEATESAAMAAYNFLGLGQEKEADRAAVDAMRSTLNSIDMNGTVVIGEGERDSAPMLYIGEEVGTKRGPEVDIALDPLEGTSICANYGRGAMSVLAVTKRGNFLNAPDVYMEKIAVGKNLPNGIVSLKNSIENNLYQLSEAKRCKISELVIIILNRPRHESLIMKIRKCGARVKLIDDGDISAVISLLNNSYDMYVGIGGAPEGVLAASVLSSIGGQMEGKLIFNTDELKKRAEEIGIKDKEKIYRVEDMVKSESIFISTGITDGDILSGIKDKNNKRTINSLIISKGVIKRVKKITYNYFNS
ncbi:MAG: fructose-1,6-bisphosphatase [Candidatus Mesenet longicola]|uniref:Fructose-1,6-bisphosphatase n=1 Tax=Candidatus Mesenet longicola TaxID=1892558 RepID=A0A8J3HVB6_9RICK|nr:MAG: fructose-1,6-bisphosphatase [Candidatus Mesenet longicola]GHM59947.1 MAG: fructose-1,6-bisphosphatase [Candidatus Mesenet longicola]